MVRRSIRTTRIRFAAIQSATPSACVTAGAATPARRSATVDAGPTAGRFFADPRSRVYQTRREPVHILMKVETHNHPTAISPYPGASIRDPAIDMWGLWTDFADAVLVASEDRHAR